jgi:hypothetical protein
MIAEVTHRPAFPHIYKRLHGTCAMQRFTTCLLPEQHLSVPVAFPPADRHMHPVLLYSYNWSVNP